MLDMFPRADNYRSDLRELIEYYRALKGNYEELVAGLEEVTQKVDDVYAYVDTELEQKVTEATARVYARMAEVEQELSNAMQALADFMQVTTNRFTSERAITDADFGEMRRYTDIELRDIRMKQESDYNTLYELIQAIKLDMLPIYDPTVGKSSTVERTANNVHRLHSGNGLRVCEVAGRALTCNDLKVLQCRQLLTSESRVRFTDLQIFGDVYNWLQGAMKWFAGPQYMDCADIATNGISCDYITTNNLDCDTMMLGLAFAVNPPTPIMP